MRVRELLMRIYGPDYDPDMEVTFYRRADDDSGQEGVISMVKVDDNDVHVQYFEGSNNLEKSLEIILT
ncbi:MAG: hypothetical protein CMP95_05110 [Gammaproteobacteria bacterium]|nr:hypothetical protein [Gammaproteobacteria bacterium]|tara:strand:+ start:829 stop:1032 length:204 start_codon:yes stop_codon:yes gene_type:complete